jgi:hypothetical protein
MQVITELGHDPGAATRRDACSRELDLKRIDIVHASTASIVVANTRHRSRLTPSSFVPRLVML